MKLANALILANLVECLPIARDCSVNTKLIVLIASQEDGHHYYPHFTDEKVKIGLIIGWIIINNER